MDSFAFEFHFTDWCLISLHLASPANWSKFVVHILSSKADIYCLIAAQILLGQSCLGSLICLIWGQQHYNTIFVGS